MNVTLNKNSWMTRLYKASYSSYILPSSLCNYFWGLVLAIILLPLTASCLILLKIMGDDGPSGITSKVMMGTIIDIFITLIFMGTYHYGTALFTNPSTTLLTTGCILSIATLIWAIIKYSRTIGHFIRENIVELITDSEAVKLVKYNTVATKEKFCPKINWVDSETKTNDFVSEKPFTYTEE